MTVALLGIIGTVLGAVWFIAKRQILKADDPAEIRRKQSEQIAQEILRDDADSANRRLTQWLRNAAIRGPVIRPGSVEAQGGTTVQS